MQVKYVPFSRKNINSELTDSQHKGESESNEFHDGGGLE